MKQKIHHLVPGAAIAAALWLAAGPASAVLITGTGSNLINYSFSSPQGGVTLSGSVNVDVTVFDTALDRVELFVTLSNTTPTSAAGDNRWTHWGFGSNPNLKSISFVDSNDGGMKGASISNFPALGLIEACATSHNNCAGGGGGGIGEGQSDSFTLILDYFDLTSAGVDLSPFGVKFQSVGANGGSVEFYTCVSNCTPPPPPPPPPPPGCEAGITGCGSQSVPEPGSLALLGLGLAGLAWMRRRPRN